MKTDTQGNVVELGEREVFIFGSNRLGAHGGGAARYAKDHFGAQDGVAEGRTGNSYAFPTLDGNYQKVSQKELESSKTALYEYAEGNKDHRFYLTPVGTGIAGFSFEEITDLFKDLPKNIIKVGVWESNKG